MVQWALLVLIVPLDVAIAIVILEELEKPFITIPENKMGVLCSLMIALQVLCIIIILTIAMPRLKWLPYGLTEKEPLPICNNTTQLSRCYHDN